MLVERVNDTLETYSQDAYTVLRLGLGLMVLLAGTHKLFRPDIWTGYTAAWAADIITTLGLSLDTFMRANGVLEAVVGLAILANRYTTVASAIVSLSMLGILINLASAGTATMDVFIRDIGLFFFAVGVTLMAAGRHDGRSGRRF
ncbi:MAG: DoxX family membrane protein [Candidatus Nanohaloarchaea archaeon]|nr:DoxX family membrane protein [Candidatus Nanohaloarchaea archaeon]